MLNHVVYSRPQSHIIEFLKQLQLGTNPYENKKNKIDINYLLNLIDNIIMIKKRDIFIFYVDIFIFFDIYVDISTYIFFYIIVYHFLGF